MCREQGAESPDEALAEALLRFLAKTQTRQAAEPATFIEASGLEGRDAEAASPLLHAVWWLGQSQPSE